MTTDDLIPPPKRVVLEIREIIFEETGAHSIKEQIDFIANMSAQAKYEDVMFTVLLPANDKEWNKVTYLNGIRNS